MPRRRATRAPLLDLDPDLSNIQIPTAEEVLAQILDSNPDERVNRSVNRVRRVRREDLPNRQRATNVPIQGSTESLLEVLTRAGVIPQSAVQSVVDVQTDVATSLLDEDFRENASSDKVNPRKLKGKIVICMRAIAGACPVLVQRAHTTAVHELDVWCCHMVPHTHRGDECVDAYDREDTIPAKFRRRLSCRQATCRVMEPVPEHRLNVKKTRPGRIPEHKRTLIL